MFDQTTASITIAGEIKSRPHLDGLIDAAIHQGVADDHGTEKFLTQDEIFSRIAEAIHKKKQLTFQVNSASLGVLEILESFCAETDLSYRRACDEVAEYDRESVVWTPNMTTPTTVLIDRKGNPLIAVNELIPLLDMPVDKMTVELKQLIDNAKAAIGDAMPAALTASDVALKAIQKLQNA